MQNKPIQRETKKHLNIFEAWYDATRNFRITAENCSVSERSLYSWCEKYNWHQRADERDKEVHRLVDAAQTKTQAERIIAQREAGTLLRERAEKYLLENPILNCRDALAAVKIGIEIERKCDLLPDFITETLAMSDSELEKQFHKLAARREAAQK